MRRGVGIVALTGASGFIGTALLAALLEAGYTVRALAHRTPLPAHPSLTPVRGSLDDAATLATLVEGAETVIHAGGLVVARRRADFFRINTQATEMLATAAQQAGVARFLFVSSLAARAPWLSAYAKSKHDAEHLLSQTTTLAWDTLRPPAIYGPGDANSLPFLRMLARGQLWLPVKRDARISMLHVDDLVRAILAWLSMQASPLRQTYEIADAAGSYRWDALVTEAQTALEHPIHLYTIPRTLALLGVAMVQGFAYARKRTSFVTIGKIREMTHADWSVNSEAFCSATGWSPNITIYDGLRDSMRWVEKQQNFA